MSYTYTQIEENNNNKLNQGNNTWTKWEEREIIKKNSGAK